MSVFTEQQRADMKEFHYVWDNVATAIESGTNSQDFAIGMLEFMLTKVTENRDHEAAQMAELLKRWNREQNV
jgi:hypothetical protein